LRGLKEGEVMGGAMVPLAETKVTGDSNAY